MIVRPPVGRALNEVHAVISSYAKFLFQSRLRVDRLAHEHVGFEEVGDGVWELYFFDRLLARLDERTWKLTA